MFPCGLIAFQAVIYKRLSLRANKCILLRILKKQEPERPCAAPALAFLLFDADTPHPLRDALASEPMMEGVCCGLAAGRLEGARSPPFLPVFPAPFSGTPVPAGSARQLPPSASESDAQTGNPRSAETAHCPRIPYSAVCLLPSISPLFYYTRVNQRCKEFSAEEPLDTGSVNHYNIT